MILMRLMGRPDPWNGWLLHRSTYYPLHIVLDDICIARHRSSSAGGPYYQVDPPPFCVSIVIAIQ